MKKRLLFGVVFISALAAGAFTAISTAGYYSRIVLNQALELTLSWRNDRTDYELSTTLGYIRSAEAQDYGKLLKQACSELQIYALDDKQIPASKHSGSSFESEELRANALAKLEELTRDGFCD